MFDTLTTEAQRILHGGFKKSGMDILWQWQRESGRGDIATSVALSLAKQLKKAPMIKI